MSRHINFRISEDLYARLEKRAAERGTGMTGIMLQLVEDFLNGTTRFNEIERAIDVVFGALADAAQGQDAAITAGYERWLKNPHRHSPGEPAA